MSSLHCEEIGFSVKASGVAGEAAVSAYDAVAGDDEGDGISSDGASDGAGVSFVCTSAGRVAAKYFCPSNQRPVSPTSSAARRMSPRGESKCCMNVIIYLEMQGI